MSQFHQLREEVRRFHDGIASPDKVMALLSNLAAGSEAAPHEAAVWQDSATHWVRATGARYSAYRDVLQPLQLAALEVKHGLALAAAAAAEVEHAAMHTTDAGQPLVAAVCTLMAFPSSSSSTFGGASESLAAQLVDDKW